MRKAGNVSTKNILWC